MRKTLLNLMLLLSATAFSTQLSAQSVATQSERKVVRVKLQREVADRLLKSPMTMSNGVVTTGITPLDRANRQVKAVSIKRLIPYSPKFEERHKAAGLDLWYEVTFDSEAATPASARSLYKTVPGVQIAEEVRPMKLIGEGKARVVSQAELAAKASADMPMNDPMLSQQWHYNNDGTLLQGAVAGADVNLFEAWKEETGKPDVIVAIIDGGFQTDHPDLQKNAWTNEAELNGEPGVDDDGNGYTDDVYGWNFVINSSDVYQHEHGTHVAGTVAAVNGNGIGVSGVAGGQNGEGGVKMMACQVFDSRSNANADFAAALVYAADMGASIAQCSWGWDTDGYYEQAVLDAIDYFTQYGGGGVKVSSNPDEWDYTNAKMSGGLCIFANGNTGLEGQYYPGCYEPVLAVGAMSPMLTPATYSTRGTWCDVTAPGGEMDYGDPYGVLSTLPNGTYGYMEGTSMACPHVSGIAALVLSKYGNPDFSNSTLKSQLTSSVNDFYTRNPDVEGLFGSGYIDAWKALQMGTGEAPEPVSDFTLTPSQDNILIEWTIPQADEGSVDHHVIYYSTSEFTASTDLSTLRSVTVDTKFQTSGDAFSYELGGLEPTTTYYVAIVAVNRYGTRAAMSPVKSATTNEGPEISLDKTELSLNVDAANGSVATDQLTINNIGKGILEYSLSANTVSEQISTSALTAPSPGRIVPASKSVQAYSAVTNYPVVTADYVQEDFPKEMTYSNGIYYYIGDSDTSKPNALAQYFYVDPTTYPDGFNLTAINFGGPGESFTPTIEIYNGSQSISTANLLTSFTPEWFTYGYDQDLEEQIFFEPGSSFWVVAKFPAGQTNPLGAGYANAENVNQYSFYSGDNGQTWTQLKQVLSEGNLAANADSIVWDVYAVSKNPNWSSVLSPEPVSGTVRPGGQQVVTMQNDGQTMPNGSYTFNLDVNTNQTDKPVQKVTVRMEVTGNKPELVTAKVVDFGELLIGQEKTLSVEVVNNGYGAFNGEWGGLQAPDNITCSSTEFEPADYIFGGFAPRSTGTFEVTFKPATAGSKSGTVTFKDKNGQTYSFVVRGVATNPAKAEVTPATYDFGDLEVGGETKTTTITVKNTGEYPLEYVFPRFSDETIGDVAAHKFGYSYESNLNGSDEFQYDGNPDLLNETDITGQFNNNVWQSEAVDLGFQFPFYGENYSRVYINDRGGVAFNQIDGNITCMVPVASCVEGLGYISAFACSGNLSMGANSKITYGRQDGKFTVKYKDVLAPALDGGDQYTPVSFHMSLCADGSVEVYYDDYDRTTTFNEGQNVFVGVADVDCADPFVVTDNEAALEGNTLYQQITTGSAIRIVAPATSMVSQLSSPSGVVGVGESKEITVTAKAVEGMYAGELKNNLTMLTNDPTTPSVNIALTANITGDGLVPVAQLDATSVDFGEVFRTATEIRPVLLSNNGTNDLVVTSVTVEGGKFTVPDDVAKGFTIKPGYGKDIMITLPTETEGEVSDVLTVNYQDGTSAQVTLSGNVIGCPEINVTPESVTVDTPYGTDMAQTLTVNNGGNEALTFSVEPNAWFNITNLETDENSSLGYIYKSKTDYDEIEYNWIDITNDPETEHQDFTYYIDKTDYYTVELPFEFPFYGKKYKTMYIYNTGFVSFSQHEDYKEFPAPPATFPTTETFYTNIIAPFWGNHSMDVSTTNGTYYKAEDDRVIISYIGYANSMMLGMDFQLILNRDGSYKFQYLLEDGGVMSGVFGLAGMQDETGETGLRLPDQCIATGNAVEFYPVKTFTVPAGGSVELPIEVLADSLGGNYETTLVMQTNVPTKPVVEIPMAISIQGEPNPVIPDAIVDEAVVGSNLTGYLETEFQVANTGSKAFKITNVEFAPDMMTTPAQLFVYAEMQQGGGIDPGPLSVQSSDSNMGWMQYDGRELEVGKEPVRFAIWTFETGMPFTVNAPVKLTFEGIDATEQEIPVDIRMTEAPLLVTTPAEGVTIGGVDVNNDYTGKGSMTIKNEGQYKLTYSLRMDPTGIGETPEVPGGEGGGGIAPWSTNKGVYSLTEAERDSLIKASCRGIEPHTVFEGFPYDVPEGYDCSNILYYPILGVEQPQTYMIGSRDNVNNFIAATRFVAPAEGFNLSKLFFYGTIGTRENVDFEAQVIQGGDVAAGTVIGQGTLRVERETPIDGHYMGEPRMLEFDKDVYINPGDTFYVALKYPTGEEVMAYVPQKEDAMEEGRFMAYNATTGWYDLGAAIYESYYSSFGYFMTCIEDVPGKPWIKLLTTETEGELAIGEEKTVEFEINGESSYFDHGNKAVIVIKSNDPTQPVVNYPITLNKNAAPVVTLPEGTITVPEGSTAEMVITVEDTEGEAFTTSVSDESGIATVSKCTLTASDGTETTVEAVEGTIEVPAGSKLQMTVTVAPDYGTAGQHTAVITAEDASGNSTDVQAIYNVEFTNRAPVYEGDDEMTVYVGQTSGVIAYSTIFSDPDDDEMTFTAELSDSPAATLYPSADGFIIGGNAAGTAELTLTATDASGATTEQNVTVNVAPATGIGNVNAGKDINVSPNPVVDRLNVVLGNDADNVNYYVYDNAGSLVATAHAAHKAAGEAQTIDMSSQGAGIYRVKVTTADGVFNATVLKK